MLFGENATPEAEMKMTSRTVTRVEPAAVLQFHVVANDKVDEISEDDAREKELNDGNTGEDRRQN